ncbi:MAG TPA: DUF4269 domain-containing protein [Cyclobacteriaceae bacterium]|nr:DUF4269 domain-containing protein [Cyclobacteriaceae bacterium]
MNDWKDISYLKTGSQAQQQAYAVLQQSQVLDKLKDFSAILLGTYPIDIAVPGSDLDIICEVKDHASFEALLKSAFASLDNFELIQKEIREVFTTICRFEFENFRFEIFGQNKPIQKQWAYRHMLIQHNLLIKYGDEFKARVMELKQKGIKTEAAFAMLLQLQGDPYVALLQLE